MYLPVLVLLAGAVLQSGLLPSLRVAGVTPDLVFLLVTGWAMLRDIDEGTVWGIIGGICFDLFSAGPFGAGIISLGVVGVLAAIVGEPLRRLHDSLPLIATAFLTVVYYLTLALTLTLLGWPVDLPSAVAVVMIPATMLNTVWMIPIFLLLRLLDRKLTGTPFTPGWLR